MGDTRAWPVNDLDGGKWNGRVESEGEFRSLLAVALGVTLSAGGEGVFPRVGVPVSVRVAVGLGAGMDWAKQMGPLGWARQPQSGRLR
jgi:hypothetical protein